MKLKQEKNNKEFKKLNGIRKRFRCLSCKKMVFTDNLNQLYCIKCIPKKNRVCDKDGSNT
jgi:Zn finger protein HypA/HybF involved in hydrogenase expression